MLNKKKYNNNVVDKLHNTLDHKSLKEPESNDKRYLSALNNRLKKISKEEATYKKISYKEMDVSEEDPFKPKVTIHFRVEKKIIEKPKVVEEFPELEVETKKVYEAEEIFEVEKVEPVQPSFVEVKPKIVEKEDKDLEFKKTIIDDEFTEWEQVSEEKKVTQEPEDLVCSECGTKLISDAKFCAKCGHKFKEDKDEIFEEKKVEPVETIVKKEEEKETEPKWEPVDFKEEKIEIEQIEVSKTAVGEISKEQVDFEKEVIPKDVKIDAFKDIKSINAETAVLLYDGGYTKIDTLKNISVKDLTKIKGIKKKVAKNIKKEVDQYYQEPVKLSPVVTEGFVKKEPKKESLVPFDNGTSSAEWEPVEVIEEEIKEEPKEEDVTEKIKDSSSHDHEKKPSVEENHMVDKKIIEYELIKEKIPETDEISRNLQENNVFKDIKSIDGRIAYLLKQNNINSIEDLKDKTVKDLVKIKGIRRKIAKNIKQEVTRYFEKNQQVSFTEPQFEEKTIKKVEDEWVTIDEEKEEDSDDLEGISGYRHGDYVLYEKTIQTKSGKTQIVRFFSKGEPEECTPIKLPDGYEVKENKKTGVPYLRKKV